jgi:hypothetical protein
MLDGYIIVFEPIWHTGQHLIANFCIQLKKMWSYLKSPLS